MHCLGARTFQGGDVTLPQKVVEIVTITFRSGGLVTDKSTPSHTMLRLYCKAGHERMKIASYSICDKEKRVRASARLSVVFTGNATDIKLTHDSWTWVHFSDQIQFNSSISAY